MSDQAVEIGDIWDELNDSEKESWQHLQNMTRSPGWKILSRDVGVLATNLSQALLRAESWDQYLFMRGQVDVLTAYTTEGIEARALQQLIAAVQERQTTVEESEEEVTRTEDFV